MTSSDVYNHLNLRVNYQNASHYYTDSMAPGGEPSPCPGLSPNDSSHEDQENIHINWHSLGINRQVNVKELDRNPVKRSHTGSDLKQTTDLYQTSKTYDTKKLPHGKSEQTQQKGSGKTLKLKQPESVLETVVLKPKSSSSSSQIQSHDEELYVNDSDSSSTKNHLRPDSHLDTQESDEYFDVSYNGQLARTSSVRSLSGSSETAPDLSDYINCGTLTV